MSSKSPSAVPTVTERHRQTGVESQFLDHLDERRAADGGVRDAPQFFRECCQVRCGLTPEKWGCGGWLNAVTAAAAKVADDPTAHFTRDALVTVPLVEQLRDGGEDLARSLGSSAH